MSEVSTIELALSDLLLLYPEHPDTPRTDQIVVRKALRAAVAELGPAASSEELVVHAVKALEDK